MGKVVKRKIVDERKKTVLRAAVRPDVLSCRLFFEVRKVYFRQFDSVKCGSVFKTFVFNFLFWPCILLLN